MDKINKFLKDFEQGLEQRKKEYTVPKPTERKQITGSHQETPLFAFNPAHTTHNHIFVYHAMDTYMVNCEFKQNLDMLNILVMVSSLNLGGTYMRFYIAEPISEIKTVEQLQLKVEQKLSEYTL